jgi:hypothetical protein
MYLSVVGLSDIPVWLFVVTDGSFTVFDAWAPDGIFRIPSRRLPTSASPSASSPSRAEPAHLAVCGSCLSWNFVLVMAHLPMAP